MPSVRIGSKTFTESVVLGEIASQLMADAGIAATHRRELGGTQVLFHALEADELDIYPEYTGTITGEILAGKKIRGEESLRADSSLYELRVRFRRGIMRGLDAMFVAVTRRQLDPFVALALVSAVEGISLELLARKPRDADFVRARGVIAGLIAMICAHPAELPAVAAAAA